DGVMLTNGPGDHEDVHEANEMIKDILEIVLIFGIYIGHQIFEIAQGATSFKMKFRHRGANHPVRDLATGKVALTSHNHGYA
ncbi:carbamoyl phosphate synthase small subunit, partial [Staphylococcus condimenti]